MNLFDVIIQAIIQGLTEFLPVSSSGHVSLYQHLSGNSGNGAQTFTLFLHVGTLIAVVLVYRKLIADLIVEFFKMCGDICKCIAGWFRSLVHKFTAKSGMDIAPERAHMPEMNETRRMVVMVIVASAWALLLFVPVFGWLGLYCADGEKVKTMADLSNYFSEDGGILAEGLFLLITGVLLFYATYLSKKREGSTKIMLRNGNAMGIAQCFAAMPGISRSGSTATVGMITGLEKNTALSMSFIMSIPAVLAETAKDSLEIFMTPEAERNLNFTAVDVFIGIIIACIVGIGAIIGLKWVVNNNKLNYFGCYCIAMGIVVVIVAIIEYANGANLFTGAPLSAPVPVSAADILPVSSADISASDVLVSLADILA